MIKAFVVSDIVFLFYFAWGFDNFCLQRAQAKYEHGYRYNSLYGYRYRIAIILMTVWLLLIQGGFHNQTAYDHASIAKGFVVITVSILASFITLLVKFLNWICANETGKERRNLSLKVICLAYVPLVYCWLKADWWYDIIYQFVEKHPF